MTKTMTAIAAALLAAVASSPAQAQADASRADAALKKAACQACHSVDKKGVGPAFKDVAQKYKGDPKAHDALVQKVRRGGAGNWGPVPMPPNGPEKISDDELKNVVAWILSV